MVRVCRRETHTAGTGERPMANEIDVRERGSALLLKAWKSGGVKLSDEVVTGLSEVLNGIQGRVETAQVGEGKTSVSIGISYDDDVPRCGNDLTQLFKKLHSLGDIPIRIIINGIPAFDALHVNLEIGNVG